MYHGRSGCRSIVATPFFPSKTSRADSSNLKRPACLSLVYDALFVCRPEPRTQDVFDLLWLPRFDLAATRRAREQRGSSHELVDTSPQVGEDYNAEKKTE